MLLDDLVIAWHNVIRGLGVEGSDGFATWFATLMLYAFDPRRAAILLLGGDKTGNDRWYEESVPTADALYDDHLRQLEREGLT